MSRVGKNPVSIPEGVTVVVEPTFVKTKGKLGELTVPYTKNVSVTLDGKLVTVKPLTTEKHARMMWGTTKRLIQNAVKGVSEGFLRELEINGVGYKAALQGKTLVLDLGFTEEIKFPVPADIKIECPKATEIKIFGASKERVGKIASDIRAFKKPEPYKGKGIRYKDEIVRRKEGKKK